MNNGLNGTGTAFLLYATLALCMPFIQLYRVIKRRKAFEHTFVAGHFTIGMLVTGVAVICAGYLWHGILHTTHGQLHTFVVVLAWVAIGTLLAWLLIPQLVRMWFRLRRKKHLLKIENALIHPLLELAQHSQMLTPVLVIDGIMSRKNWRDFRRKHRRAL